MLIKFLGFLALLVPELSRASPVTKPEDLLALEKRTNIGSYVNYFPDCSQDPSNAEGPSAYKDGDGVPVTSSCDNKLSTPAVNRYHCWTDLFVVNHQATYVNWQNSGQVIDCAKTSSCSEVSINLNSTCTTDSTTWDNDIGVAIQAQIPLWFNKDASATGTLKYDHNFGGAKDVQVCTSEGSTGTCTWDDKACHAVWTAQRNIQVHKYAKFS